MCALYFLGLGPTVAGDQAACKMEEAHIVQMTFLDCKDRVRDIWHRVLRERTYVRHYMYRTSCPEDVSKYYCSVKLNRQNLACALLRSSRYHETKLWKVRPSTQSARQRSYRCTL